MQSEQVIFNQNRKKKKLNIQERFETCRKCREFKQGQEK